MHKRRTDPGPCRVVGMTSQTIMRGIKHIVKFSSTQPMGMKYEKQNPKEERRTKIENINQVQRETEGR